MEHTPLMLAAAPDLTDDAATEILDFLYDLTSAFENHYFAQLRRHQQSLVEDRNQPDLFEPFDDELPDF